MRVALDGVALGNRSGTGRYVELLMEGMKEALPPDDSMVVFVRPDFEVPRSWREISRIDFIPVTHAFPSRFGKIGGQLAWRRWLSSWLHERENTPERIDLFHGPAFVLPSLPETMAAVLTVHDLAFYLYPETLPLGRRWFLQRAVPKALMRANRVLVDCDAVGRELRDYLNVETEIETILLGVRQTTRNRLPLWPDCLPGLEPGARYWLTLSTLEPRKNLERLVLAYRLASNTMELPPLVLIGRRGWGREGLDRLLDEPLKRGRIVQLGFVPDAKLVALLDYAELFLAPSLYEGCDLPALEAAARGVPIVASDIRAHRQYLPDYTVFINPYDTAEWINRLRSFSKNPSTRKSPLVTRKPKELAIDTLKAYQSTLM